MTRWIDSWLPGSSAGPGAGPSGAHRGERFGLPQSGPGSATGFGRRLAAITIDWLLGYLIATLFAGPDPFGVQSNLSWTVWLVWFLLTAVPTAIFGATPGMTIIGLRVARIDDAALVGVPRALLRTALLGLVVPALIRDDDGRGWHDRATRTIVLRTR
ncbi:RDD family protein [Pseudonocardia hispaniensis]|uniref:RDD family protein n=1 Tax=Pseudonocardia hispaniensis TaxID=904933 RepID=A0ABW1J0T0_9PSEU